jgi:hypothetical protein
MVHDQIEGREKKKNCQQHVQKQVTMGQKEVSWKQTNLQQQDPECPYNKIKPSQTHISA